MGFKALWQRQCNKTSKKNRSKSFFSSYINILHLESKLWQKRSKESKFIFEAFDIFFGKYSKNHGIKYLTDFDDLWTYNMYYGFISHEHNTLTWTQFHERIFLVEWNLIHEKNGEFQIKNVNL